MQRDTARLAASGANETAGPAPLEQERRAPRLVRKRFLKLGKRTPPRHRSFIPAIPHGRLDHSHTICSSYLSQRDKPSEFRGNRLIIILVNCSSGMRHDEGIASEVKQSP